MSFGAFEGRLEGEIECLDRVGRETKVVLAGEAAHVVRVARLHAEFQARVAHRHEHEAFRFDHAEVLHLVVAGAFSDALGLEKHARAQPQASEAHL